MGRQFFHFYPVPLFETEGKPSSKAKAVLPAEIWEVVSGHSVTPQDLV